ncbi:MAG TPA: hypothetical protein VGB42_03120, partial [Candidatus Thermoplasmatota archaeon]
PDGSVLVMLRTEDFSGDSTTSGFTRSPSGQWEPPYSFARDLFSPGDFDGVALAGGGALVEFSPVNNSVYTLGLAQRPPAGCGGWESAPDAGVGNVSYGFAAARAGAGSVVLLFGQYAASTNRVMAAFVDVVASSAVPAPTVTYPPDGSNVSSPVAVVEGFTEPFFAVYAGGAVGQAGANGSFRVPVPLLSGANRLAVRAAPVGATCLSLATLLTLTFEDPVPGLVADLAKARADLDGALGALGAAQAQLDAAQARIDALSASGNATQAELDAALADLAAANETLQRMKGDFSRLTANLTATQEELDRVKVQFPWLEANLSAAQANVTAFKGEIVAVEAQLDASQAALAEADAEILLLKARDNQTTTLLQDATDNNAALSGQVTTLSIVAFIALLAAIAAIGLALVQGRRGGGGGGGSGVDSQNAGIATPGGSGEGGASSKKVEVRGWDPKKKEE